MKLLYKSLALGMALWMAAASLIACQPKEQEPAPLPPLDLISPETLYEKLLRDERYQIYVLYDAVSAEGVSRSVDYRIFKDGEALKLYYAEDDEKEGRYKDLTYCDLTNGRLIYRDALYEWVWDRPDEGEKQDDLEDYLIDALPLDPEFMMEDRNFVDLAKGETVYEIDKEAFWEFMEEENTDLPVTLTVQVDGQSYLIKTAYELSDRSTVDCTVRVKFEEKKFEIPKSNVSTEYPTWSSLPKSICYQDDKMELLLRNKVSVTNKGLILTDSIRSDGIQTFAGEGPERLFDGVDTATEWYYDKDGKLKPGADPGKHTGGGPGKCCGEAKDMLAYFFFSTQEEVTVQAYLLTNANDNQDFRYRTPIYWILLGSNDEAAADCTDFYEADWVTLDAVYEDEMYSTDNFEQFGFAVDEHRQGAYRHYCFIAVSGYPQIQIGELELYIAE